MSFVPALAFLSALAVVALTQFDPTGGSLSLFEPIVWLGLALVAWSRSWWTAVPVALALTVLRGFAVAEQICRFYLQRPLELRNDIRLIPDLQNVLTNTGGHRMLTAVAVGLGLFVFVVAALLMVSAENRRAVGAAFVVVAVAALAVPGKTMLSARLLVELTSTDADLERKIREEHRARARWSDLRDRGFRGRDVHVVLIESYGDIVFGHPALEELRSSVLPYFERRLADAGYSVASTLYRSPTFGGRSWLAHGSIDSGIMITDQLRYERLLRSEVVPLAEHFNRAGYYTATVAPGITKPFPEGRWFGYQEGLYLEQIAYTGPRFGWATVPDQWLLDRVGRSLLRAPKPRFVEWHLVSTHAPFATHAPYLAPEQLALDAPYEEATPVRFDIQWPYLARAHEGYAHALTYELEVLADALPELLGEDGIAVLVGDHQPNGAMMQSDASWDVPCHVVSRDDPWPGFTPGIIPAATVDAPPLAELYEDLLRSETRPAVRIGRGGPLSP